MLRDTLLRFAVGRGRSANVLLPLARIAGKACYNPRPLP